jgi:hypothetical protein
MAVLRAIVQGSLPTRPEVHIPSNTALGDRLWSLLELCCAFDPEARPTADEVCHIVSVNPIDCGYNPFYKTTIAQNNGKGFRG